MTDRVGWLALGVVVGGELILRFTNGDLTEAELFATYWPIHVAAVAIVFGVVAVSPSRRRHR